MVVALDERRRGRAAWAWATTGGADYWLGRNGLATPTPREQRTGSRRPRPGRDGLVTPTLRGRLARGACDETATCEWHPPCLLAARGGVTRVRRHDVAACVGSVALGVTHFITSWFRQGFLGEFSSQKIWTIKLWGTIKSIITSDIIW